MKNLEVSGKTVEEATQRALEQLGAGREEVEVSVVKEGKSGILGLGSEEAIVRVSLLESKIKEKDDAAETARDILEKLLALLGVTGSIELASQPVFEEVAGITASVVLNIEGEDLGILIGRRGQTLACLQYIVRLIVSHQTKTWVPLIIDVEEYKQRRYQALQVFARNLGERVKTTGKPFTLEPMPAFERRIIHLALAGETAVATESIGQGDLRKVVIVPKKQ